MQVTADALGGYFAVTSLLPSTSFYEQLRDNGADPSRIFWCWLSMVHFFVDLAVQGNSEGEGTPNVDSPSTKVLLGLIHNTKAIGLDSEDDLSAIEGSNSIFWELLSKFMSREPAATIDIGQSIASIVGCEIVNPATLFGIGQEFLELHLSVFEKFSQFQLI